MSSIARTLPFYRRLFTAHTDGLHGPHEALGSETNAFRGFRDLRVCGQRLSLVADAGGQALLVVLFVHPSPEDPPAQRPEPAEHVVHVAEIHQLDEIAVEVLAEE